MLTCGAGKADDIVIQLFVDEHFGNLIPHCKQGRCIRHLPHSLTMILAMLAAQHFPLRCWLWITDGKAHHKTVKL